jgi:hypothetical protein
MTHSPQPTERFAQHPRQAHCERRAVGRVCPVCHEVA